MAIQSVRVQVNGQWTNLQLVDGAWQATITAPGATSYNLPGGYYPVTVEATNTAGTTATATATTPEIGESLEFFVKETVPPVISILSPTDGAYVSNNQQPIVFTVVDESGGSGVNEESISVSISGGTILNVQKGAITNGYQCTATPNALTDGSYTVTISANDNDGNVAQQKTVTFTVDTVPPILNLTSPAEDLITAQAALAVSGTTNDSTSSPVTITIALNESDQGPVTVGEDGSFSKIVTLSEGENNIVVTATDLAGKTTSVARTVTLGTSVPEIVSVSIVPNPADTSASVLVKVVVQ